MESPRVPLLAGAQGAARARVPSSLGYKQVHATLGCSGVGGKPKRDPRRSTGTTPLPAPRLSKIRFCSHRHLILDRAGGRAGTHYWPRAGLPAGRAAAWRRRGGGDSGHWCWWWCPCCGSRRKWWGGRWPGWRLALPWLLTARNLPDLRCPPACARTPACAPGGPRALLLRLGPGGSTALAAPGLPACLPCLPCPPRLPAQSDGPEPGSTRHALAHSPARARQPTHHPPTTLSLSPPRHHPSARSPFSRTQPQSLHPSRGAHDPRILLHDDPALDPPLCIFSIPPPPSSSLSCPACPSPR